MCGVVSGVLSCYGGCGCEARGAGVHQVHALTEHTCVCDEKQCVKCTVKCRVPRDAPPARRASEDARGEERRVGLPRRPPPLPALPGARAQRRHRAARRHRSPRWALRAHLTTAQLEFMWMIF